MRDGKLQFVYICQGHYSLIYITLSAPLESLCYVNIKIIPTTYLPIESIHSDTFLQSIFIYIFHGCTAILKTLI